MHLARPNAVMAAVVSTMLTFSACDSRSTASSPGNAPRRQSDAARGSPAATAASLKTIAIRDPALDMTAATISIPRDWQGDGTMLHQSCDLTPITTFRANSTGGLVGVQIFPRFDTIWSAQQNAASQTNGCRFSAPKSPVDFVRDVLIPLARPSATIVSVGPVPDDKTTQQIAIANANAPAQQAALNRQVGAEFPPIHYSGISQRVLIRYVSNRHPMDEYLDVQVVSQEQPQLAVGFGGRHFTWVTKTQTTVVGTRAVSGQLDRAQRIQQAMGASLKTNPEWYKRSLVQAQQIVAQQTRSNGVRANEFARNAIGQIRETGALSMANAAKLEAARHQGAQQTAQYIGDRETVFDPATGRTGEVSNQFNHSYYDAQSGRTIQTNSASNPGANWTELQVVSPR